VNLASVSRRMVHILWRRCCSDRRRRTGRCSTALTFIWQLPNLCIMPPLLGGSTYPRHVEGCAAPSFSGRNETPSAGGCADGLRAWLTCTCGTPAAGVDACISGRERSTRWREGERRWIFQGLWEQLWSGGGGGGVPLPVSGCRVVRAKQRPGIWVYMATFDPTSSHGCRR